jgi:three-Cys-motif partner protein
VAVKRTSGRSVIKDWGCDCVFFFNYPRVNAGIANPLVDHHMKALFGEENLAKLRAKLHPYLLPYAREAIVVEHMRDAMTDAGAKFVQTFRFRNENDTRTTHYLVFVTKHPLGFEVMKGISCCPCPPMLIVPPNRGGGGGR